jgi:hypothetical protein
MREGNQAIGKARKRGVQSAKRLGRGAFDIEYHGSWMQNPHRNPTGEVVVVGRQPAMFCHTPTDDDTAHKCRSSLSVGARWTVLATVPKE